MERTPDVQLSRRLRLARHARGLSQKALAAQAGISVQHLSKLERGRQSLLLVRGAVLVQLAQALQVSVDFLLGLSAESDIDLDRTAMLSVGVTPLGA